MTALEEARAKAAERAKREQRPAFTEEQFYEALNGVFNHLQEQFFIPATKNNDSLQDAMLRYVFDLPRMTTLVDEQRDAFNHALMEAEPAQRVLHPGSDEWVTEDGTLLEAIKSLFYNSLYLEIGNAARKEATAVAELRGLKR